MIWFILSMIICVVFTFRMWTTKYLNPYKLILYYGKKGCGKSSMAQKIIYKHSRGRHPWHIYYNEGDSTFKQGTPINAARLWEYQYEPHSLIIIDEVNLLWDNRDFKTFPKELGKFFRLQRHYKVKIVLFSQTADADKKIRDLTDRVYLTRKYWNVLTIATPYEKDIQPLIPPNSNLITDFQDSYIKKSWGPFGCEFCWLPKWIKTHDSFKITQNTHS